MAYSPIVIPSAMVAIVLALGTFRVVRLIGWDDLPALARLRGRATGEAVYYNTAENRDNAIYRYRRPKLQHFLNCAFCQGFWWSVAVYVSWRVWPTGTVTVLAPFALSAAVGLLAKNLDP